MKQMREIKFRAWNKYSEKYEYSDIQGWSFFGDCVFDDQAFEVEQYTGLKDKNGKEIYEGDILNCSKVNYKLKRHRSGAYELYEILSTGKCSSRPYFLFHHIDKVEIIGNINKNPELLNPTK